MKMTVLGLAIGVGLTMGCAHGTAIPGGAAPAQELRGSARVGHEARAIVAGPALLVHATGDKPVRWFVAPRVTGGDLDCASDRPPSASLPESPGVHLTIAPGQVLCAAVAQGATDVMWHQVLERSTNLWAFR
jgi:hypothetical protein